MTPQKVKQMQTALLLVILALAPACLVQHKINVWAGKVNAHCQQNGGKDACLTYPACEPTLQGEWCHQ